MIKEIKFDIDRGEKPVLLCPICSYGNLHHAGIEVFNRNEDAEEGTHIKTDADSILIDTCLEGNPSTRRSGLKIKFCCEHHEDIFELNIAQHKGETFMWWS